MATVAELDIDAKDLALEDTFGRLPAVRIDLERVVSTDVPFVWIDGAIQSDIESALDADPSVRRFSAVTGDGGEWLYNLEFTEGSQSVLELLLEEGAILEATGADSRWSITLRFPDRSSVNGAYERLRERDIGVTVVRLSDVTEHEAPGGRLTDQQREALVAALEHGYFEIPRETSMKELADELGISHQALSERLRRAFETLTTEELNGRAERPPSP